MNSFEAECHQLSDQLKEVQRAYERLQSENAALEMNLRAGKAASFASNDRPLHLTSTSAEQANRPVRPTPKGWVSKALQHISSSA